MNYTRYEVSITLLAPAILGGVLGYLIYQGVTGDEESPVLLLLFVIGGVLVLSGAAYLFRRFLLPNDQKDEVK